MPKLQYVATVKGWDWIIGSGLYMDDLDAEVRAAELELTGNIVRSYIGFALHHDQRDILAATLEQLAHAGLGLAGLALLLALWWAATDLLAAEGSFARRFSPGDALPALAALVTGPDLWTHVAVSLKRVLVGLGLALLAGVPLGLLIGASRLAEAAATPAFQFLRMISPLSWMPIAVLVFGVGDAPIYFLLAFAAGLILMAYAMRNLSWFGGTGTPAPRAVTAKPGGTTTDAPGNDAARTAVADPVALATREAALAAQLATLEARAAAVSSGGE